VEYLVPALSSMLGSTRSQTNGRRSGLPPGDWMHLIARMRFTGRHLVEGETGGAKRAWDPKWPTRARRTSPRKSALPTKRGASDIRSARKHVPERPTTRGKIVHKGQEIAQYTGAPQVRSGTASDRKASVAAAAFGWPSLAPIA
jgi:hypothetical protein